MSNTPVVSTTVQQARDYFDYMCQIGRGNNRALLNPQDLCWGCDLQKLTDVSVLELVIPETVESAINVMRREVYIGARVVER